MELDGIFFEKYSVPNSFCFAHKIGEIGLDILEERKK
jgi:hypothetical protein